MFVWRLRNNTKIYKGNLSNLNTVEQKAFLGADKMKNNTTETRPNHSAQCICANCKRYKSYHFHNLMRRPKYPLLREPPWKSFQVLLSVSLCAQTQHLHNKNWIYRFAWLCWVIMANFSMTAELNCNQHNSNQINFIAENKDGELRKMVWAKFSFLHGEHFWGDGRTNRRHRCRCLKCWERKERILSIVAFAKLISTGFASATINFRQCFSPGGMGLILSVPLQWAALSSHALHITFAQCILLTSQPASQPDGSACFSSLPNSHNK